MGKAETRAVEGRGKGPVALVKSMLCPLQIVSLRDSELEAGRGTDIGRLQADSLPCGSPDSVASGGGREGGTAWEELGRHLDGARLPLRPSSMPRPPRSLVCVLTTGIPVPPGAHSGPPHPSSPPPQCVLSSPRSSHAVLWTQAWGLVFATGLFSFL